MGFTNFFLGITAIYNFRKYEGSSAKIFDGKTLDVILTHFFLFQNSFQNVFLVIRYFS